MLRNQPKDEETLQRSESFLGNSQHHATEELNFNESKDDRRDEIRANHAADKREEGEKREWLELILDHNRETHEFRLRFRIRK